MLAKKNRLNLKTEQRQCVLKSGKRFFSRYFTSSLVKNTNDFQVAVIIPKSKIALASARNRLKRLVFQAVDQKPPGKLWTIIRYIGSSQTSEQEIVGDLRDLLRRMND
ncbi:MAG: ribonuclease P protein component [Patescibacteria group bacterium]